MTTVYDFELPRGYVNSAGEIHRRGKVHLATARDEISVTKNPKVLENPSYLTMVILSGVVAELEGMSVIAPTTMEQLFTTDLTFLQDMYQRINDVEPPMVRVVYPSCSCVHKIPTDFTREG